MDNRPIGIFDSGLGGLTGLFAVHALLPNENIVYFGDTGRIPYGEKTRSQLRDMAIQNLEFVSSFGVKAILAACGTISANAADLLEAWPIPCFGVLDSSADWLSRLPGGGPIAIAATEAAVRSGAYQTALQRACPGRRVFAVPCPSFVPLIESGHRDLSDPLIREAVRCSLAPVREAGAEALLLGCTHYGIISPAISDYLGSGIRLVSAAECGAAAVCAFLMKSGCTGHGHGTIICHTSGDVGQFSDMAARLFGPLPPDFRVEAAPLLPIPCSGQS